MSRARDLANSTPGVTGGQPYATAAGFLTIATGGTGVAVTLPVGVFLFSRSNPTAVVTRSNNTATGTWRTYGWTNDGTYYTGFTAVDSTAGPLGYVVVQG